jgi:serine/threonine protein kinase
MFFICSTTTTPSPVFVSQRKFAKDGVETELQLLRQVSHPNITTFYDAWDTPDGNTVFITELAISGTLKE